MRALTVCVFLLLVTSIADAQTVSYTVSIPKPTSSLLHVVMEIRGAQGASVDIAMPAWSPGSYNLHWAAKNVQRSRGAGRQRPPARRGDDRHERLAHQAGCAGDPRQPTTSTWARRRSTTRTRPSSARGR